MKPGATLVVCSSAAFYKQVVQLKQQLEATGLVVVIPKTAAKMAETGDFEVEHYKTWFANADDYDKKADLMRAHFDEISNGDAILVVNNEKHGHANYIGPNVLMEMSLAWYQNKAIYLLNAIPNESPFEEEIKGMNPIALGGNISKLMAA